MHAAAEIQVRSDAEYFTAPSRARQRRYEALRAYFIEESTAAEVSDSSVIPPPPCIRYPPCCAPASSTPSPRPSLARKSRAKPPARSATSTLVASLRPQHPRDLRALSSARTPISAQTVCQILYYASLPPLSLRYESLRFSPALLEPFKAATLQFWPYARRSRVTTPDYCCCSRRWPRSACPSCDPGLLPVHLSDHCLSVYLHPAAVQVRTPPPRPSHLLVDLLRLPLVLSATDRTAQSHPLLHLLLPRAPRIQHQTAHPLVKALRPLRMASGTERFNLDFHAIRHHGDDTVL